MEEGFAPTIRAIKKWQPEVRKELRHELKGAGEMIAGGARLLADAHSKTAGATIKVRSGVQSKKVEVKVQAGSPDVPIAGLLEEGNRKKRADPNARGPRKSVGAPKFSHPVFANVGGGQWKGAWAEQAMHPYLAPIVKLRQAAVAKRVRAAVQRSIDTVKLG